MSKKPYRVLCVDDQGVVRSYLNHIFKTLQFESVQFAADGVAAWNMLQSHPIDLVVCDWQMERMSGLELLQKVRADDRLQDLPFIMLTGAADRAHVMQAVEAGVTNYLVKPFSRASVAAAVKQARVKRRPGPRESEPSAPQAEPAGAAESAAAKDEPAKVAESVAVKEPAKDAESVAPPASEAEPGKDAEAAPRAERVEASAP